MTHVFFDPDNIDWSSFLAVQEGRGKYFVGTRYQRGYGILQNIARFLLPIAKNVASVAGQEGISAGTKILGDISQGRNIKESLMEHGKSGLENLATKMQQCGKGKQVKRRRRYIDQLTYV